MRMASPLTAFVIAAALVLALVIVPVVMAFSAQRQVLKVSLEQLARYQQRSNERSILQSRIRAERSRLENIPGLIMATNASLAEAAQQNIVRELVQEQHGEIRSAQVAPPITTHGFQRISVEYDMVIHMSHLTNLIYAVESHTPYLFIDAADIIGPAQSTRQLRDPQLEVRWTISAYRQVPP